MGKFGVAGILSDGSLIVYQANGHAMTAQAADNTKPLIIATDYDRARSFCAPIVIFGHVDFSTVLTAAIVNRTLSQRIRLPLTKISRALGEFAYGMKSAPQGPPSNSASQHGRGEFGAGHKPHEWAKAPGRRRP